MQSSTHSDTRRQADDNKDALGHCPYLGSKTDPAVPSEFPSEDNRCLSTRLAVPISTLHQENYCFSAQYEACPVYKERAKRANGANLVPLAAVYAAGAEESPLSWADEIESFEPVAQGAAVAASLAPPAAQSPLRLQWEDNTHPDFQADITAASARRYRPPADRRPWLLVLLLLLLIPLGWWLWSNARPGTRDAGDTVEGTIVTLPTLLATSAAETRPEDISSNDDALPLPLIPAGVDEVAGAPTLEPTTEPTKSPLESIAATATALFADATAVTGCVAPSWWTSYVVEEGDTIEALALARGILPEELIAVNCLTGPELEAGVPLLLPPVGVVAAQPSPTVAPTATATRPPGLPTRAPILFPTPTFPSVVIILTPQAPTLEPTDEPATRPPARPTKAPTSAAPPTSTVPSPGGTATPPALLETATPPSAEGGSATPTQTPPPPTP